MFPVGMLLLLGGYTGMYVSVYRLGGDARSIQQIVMGANGGKPIHLPSAPGSKGPTLGEQLSPAGQSEMNLARGQAEGGTAGGGAVGYLQGILSPVLPAGLPSNVANGIGKAGGFLGGLIP